MAEALIPYPGSFSLLPGTLRPSPFDSERSPERGKITISVQEESSVLAGARADLADLQDLRTAQGHATLGLEWMLFRDLLFSAVADRTPMSTAVVDNTQEALLAAAIKGLKTIRGVSYTSARASAYDYLVIHVSGHNIPITAIDRVAELQWNLMDAFQGQILDIVIDDDCDE